MPPLLWDGPPPGVQEPHPLLLLVFVLLILAGAGIIPRLARRLAAPIGWIDRQLGELARRLNRPYRQERELARRGALLALVTALAGLLGGGAVVVLVEAVPELWPLTLAALAVLLAPGVPGHHARRVTRALLVGSLPAAKAALEPLSARDPDSLDAHAVGRASIEALSASFLASLVGPVFWFLLLGLPGLALSRLVGLLGARLAPSGPAGQAFARGPSMLDQSLAVIPSFLATLLVAGGAILRPPARPGQALARSTQGGAAGHAPVGRVEAALAGSLDLALGGPRQYPEAKVDDPWLGAGRARVEPLDILAALAVLGRARLLLLALLAALGLAAAGS